MSKKLNEITKELGESHEFKVYYDVNLKENRQEFFDAVTQHIEKLPLSTKTVPYPDLESLGFKGMDEWVKIYHPGWKVASVQLESDSDSPPVRIILAQDPSLVKFTWYNPEDNKVYQRNVIEEAPSLDDESLAQDHPDVWWRISESIPPSDEALDLLYDYTEWDTEGVEEWLNDRMNDADYEWPRRLKNLELVDPGDLSIISDYMVPGQLSLRLEKPREAKPEEINDPDDN